ncbi:TolC family protein [Leptospira andrefontaineae]|uniref:TolC family protein n=2 Tax=Leptospira andrefontaineae TaxID=2484976 RepID=A0A4R9HAH3_9LEPT|nr:TolC family protein [Leptospira andrefontaineae]TGK43537.1 TolC family protein [Leptospira andrefontaineae]
MNRYVLKTACLFLVFILPYHLFPKSDSLNQSQDKLISLSLEKAVWIGTTNNVILKVLEARKDVTKMMITERWREFLPKFGVQYFGLRNQNIGSQDNIYNDIRLTVQQLIFDGGEANLNLEIAKLADLMNEQDFKINLSKVKLEIQKAYFKALAAGAKVFVGQTTVNKMQESLKKGQIELKQGFITKIQLMEIESKLKQAEFNLQKNKTEKSQTLMDLKQAMNLDYYVEIELEESLLFDFVMNQPQTDLDLAIAKAREEREDLKKMQLIVKKVKNEKEIADNYYMPKLYLGGYAGRNGNNNAFQHDAYGLNFNLVFPFGSSSVLSNGNLGVQKDGTGIQTYPGFGNQTVGAGTNSYNSTTVKLFENLAQSRKVVEGEIQFAEALLNYKNMENQIGFEIKKTVDRLNQSWELIKIANSRVNLQWESIKVASAKHGSGHTKKEDLINSELELVKAQEELTEALAGFATTCYEYAHVTKDEVGLHKFLSYEKGKGNSIIANLTKGKQ